MVSDELSYFHRNIISNVNPLTETAHLNGFLPEMNLPRIIFQQGFTKN